MAPLQRFAHFFPAAPRRISAVWLLAIALTTAPRLLPHVCAEEPSAVLQRSIDQNVQDDSAAPPFGLPTPWQTAGIKAALADSSPAARAAAVGICADMHWTSLLDPAQVTPLLADSDDVTRAAAARALGQMDNPINPGMAFAGEIAPLLKDGSSAVRIAAAESLGRLGRKGADYAPQIAPLLTDFHNGVRLAAVEALERIGSPTPEEMENARPASTSIPGLGPPPEVVPPEKPNYPLRNAIAGQIAPLLADVDYRVGCAAAKALQHFDADPLSVTRLLLPLLADKRPLARGLAAVLLGKLGDPAFSGQIVALLQDKSFFARDFAIEALGKLGASDSITLRRVLPYLSASDIPMMKKPADEKPLLEHEIQAPSVADFIPVLNLCPAAETRSAAAEALGQMANKDFDAAAPLFTLLKDADSRVRCSAARALIRLPSAEQHAPELVALLKNGDPLVRQSAVEAFTRLDRPSPDSIWASKISELLHDADPGARAIAADTLSRMGEDGVEHAAEISALLTDTSPKVRETAALTLGRMGKDAVPFIDQIASLLADPDANVRAGAAAALGAMTYSASRFASQIAPLLADSDPRVRASAALALGSVGAASAKFAGKIAPLLADLDEAGARNAAATTLGNLGEAAAPFAPQIHPLLADGRPFVRRSAIEALKNIDRPGAGAGEDAARIAPLLADEDEAVRSCAGDALLGLARNSGSVSSRILPLLKEARALENHENSETYVEFSTECSQCIVEWEERNARIGSGELKESVLRLLDIIGNSSGDLKERDAFFASALEILGASDPDDQPLLRAHLRLWCGSDERLQFALDWLGEPNPAPAAAALSPAQLRQLLSLFTDLQGSPAISGEIATRIGQIIAAAPASLRTDTELAGALEKLSGQCRARAGALRAEDAPGQPLEAEPSAPPSPWEMAGIKAALADSSEGVRAEAVKFCFEKKWDKDIGLKSEQIIPLLEDDRITPDSPILDALARMGRTDPTVTAKVTPFLKSHSQNARILAATALAEMGDSGADYAAQVAQLLAEPGDLRDTALVALGKMRRKGAAFADRLIPMLPASPLTRPFWRGKGVPTLPYGSAGSEIVQMSRWNGNVPRLLAPTLKDPERIMRERGLYFFCNLRRHRTTLLEQTIPLLEDADLYLRMEAAWFLSQCPLQSSVFAPQIIAAGGLRLGPRNTVLAMHSVLIEANPAYGPYTQVDSIPRSAVDPSSLPRLLRENGRFVSDLLAQFGETNPVTLQAIPLSPALKTQNEGDRAWAIDTILRRGPEGARQVVAMLKDSSKGVRFNALISMDWIPKEFGSFAKEIAPLLQDPDARVREYAIDGLSQEGEHGEAFAGKIAPLLKDSDEGVRAAASKVLRGMRGNEAALLAPMMAILSDKSSDQRNDAIITLGEMGSRHAVVAPRVAALLNDGDPTMRIVAIKTLGGMGKMAAAFAEKISDLLHDGNDDVRAAAVEALAQIGGNGIPVAQRIVPLLKDGNPGLRILAIRALSGMGKLAGEFAENVSALLYDENDEVRVAAVEGLARLGENGVPVAKWIAPLLTDSNHGLRSAVAEALGNLPGESAPFTGLIASLLQDSDTGVRIAASHALSSLGHEGAPFAGQIAALLEDGEGRVRGAAAVVLSRTGRDGVPFVKKIAKQLHDHDAAARAGAATAIGALDVDGAPYAAQVAALMNDNDADVRRAAIAALPKCGLGNDKQAAPLLAQLLSMANGHAAASQIHEPREAATQVLSELRRRGSEYATQLSKLLKDQDEDMRTYAVDELRELGKDASPAGPLLLTLAVDSPHEFLRSRAREVLDNVMSPDVPKKDRAVIVASGLKMLPDAKSEVRARLRFLLRLWCGDDAELQRSLD